MPEVRPKIVAFFPEAAFGPALNSVGIAQAIARLGHKAVFLSDPGFLDVYRGYGFEAYPVNLSAPMPPEEMAKFWEDFINGHIPDFYKTPYDQIDNYVKDCWAAIVDSARYAVKDLPGVLRQINPDLICVDNVILFPTIKQCGVPWVRIVSCSENEIEDPAIPPHLSGCAADDVAGHARFRQRFNEVIAPLHADFNAFLSEQREKPYPLGQFFEVSPFLNLLLYPEAMKFKRAHPLAPAQFQYLEGCVRQEKPYAVPDFHANSGKPLVYLSFGSLGAGDVDLLKRMIAALGRLPYRALVNVGGYIDQYTDIPANVIIDSWFPQPSVIPQVDIVIHHGGNNSFTECLLFGKPAIIMPFVWDGHDNAMRVAETGHGFRMCRADWTEAELAARLQACLTDQEMHARLKSTSVHMRAQDGPATAARLLDALIKSSAPHLAVASTRSDLVPWGVQPEALEGVSTSSGRVLFKGPNAQPESGLWSCTPGRWKVSIPRDELCYFVAGRAVYERDDGERIEITPGTLVMFPAGWSGICTVHETVRNTYMLTSAAPAAVISSTPALRDPLAQTNLLEWGLIPTMLEGESRTSGMLIHKGPEGRSECGIWRCTPGKWLCQVTRDEYCHFLAGRSTYVHENGEVIQIMPDTVAFFPQDWKGVCTVHETIVKVYMIR